MNKLLVAVFDTETAADAGLKALRGLHEAGDITLYASGLLTRDMSGQVTVRKPLDASPVGAASGLAVGALIGLLAGPAGAVVGAVAGTMAGAMRDFWVAGVGLDFIEEAQSHLQPGKTALVAEVEEEWVIPVDDAVAVLGGRVFRRSRSELAEAQLDHDVAAFKAEIESLEAEATQASGDAKARLQTRLAAVHLSLDNVVLRAREGAESLKAEADAKGESLKRQLAKTQGAVKARVEDRIKRVKSAYHARGAKLSQAWHLTKEALSA